MVQKYALLMHVSIYALENCTTQDCDSMTKLPIAVGIATYNRALNICGWNLANMIMLGSETGNKTQRFMLVGGTFQIILEQK
jgi:hypothetical protein